MAATEMGVKRRSQICLLGGGGVGKSALTVRLVHDSFKEHYDPTIEDSYCKDNFQCDGEISPLEIMDSAGQVRIDKKMLPINKTSGRS